MMKTKWINYLKTKGLSAPSEVDSLFVSAFVQENGWVVKRCSVIKDILGYDGEIVSEFIKILRDDGCFFSVEDLMKLFEFVISPSDRIVNGAIYTPKLVRSKIVKDCLDRSRNLWKVRVADISCGCGGFLVDVALWIHKKAKKDFAAIYRENLWGIDIQDYAIRRTKIVLSLLAISEGEDVDFDFNLLCRDTLDYADDQWDARYRDFDVIVGNPPYVCSRNLSAKAHEKLKRYEVCSSGHSDLYIPFFQIAINILNDKGLMGYITMNTFLRSVNGRAVRKYFAEHKYDINIIDFRGYQIFETKSAYTCLFYLSKRHKAVGIRYAVDDGGQLKDTMNFTYVNYADLDNDKGWTLNEYSEVSAIESVGIQIKDYCPSRHGIATLNNETFIFKPAREDRRYFYLENNGISYPIERNICRDVVNPNKLNSADGINLLIEKVIYPYHIENEKAIVYTPTEMMNSFPKAYAYLKSRKKVLLSRDKGNTSSYPQWYAFGRTQSLLMPRHKLFFPKFANRPLRCVISNDPELMLYNGLAFVNDKVRKLRILKAIIESKLFWNYIQANAKPYASGYYSLSGVDIKHFGIPMLTEAEEDELLAMDDKGQIERWLKLRYVRQKVVSPLATPPNMI